VKPFSPRELTARVAAAVRRIQRAAGSAAQQVLACAGLRLDPTYRTATLDDQELP
jgi:two-component system alkaline phosphatase synthesis response regulator PhoP